MIPPPSPTFYGIIRILKAQIHKSLKPWFLKRRHCRWKCRLDSPIPTPDTKLCARLSSSVTFASGAVSVWNFLKYFFMPAQSHPSLPSSAQASDSAAEGLMSASELMTEVPPTALPEDVLSYGQISRGHEMHPHHKAAVADGRVASPKCGIANRATSPSSSRVLAGVHTRVSSL